MKRNRDGLTEDEIKFLRSEKASPLVREFASRQHESLGVRTSAYRKVAAAARAEREAILEVAALKLARAAAANSAAEHDRVSKLEGERRNLERQLEETRRRLLIATATPALATHSEGTRR